MKVIRQSKQNVNVAIAAKAVAVARPQNQARQIVCRFVRETIFTKRVTLALAAAVYLLAILVQPTTAKAAGVGLNWDAATGANVVGYNVYYGVSSGNYTSKAFVGNVTNSTVTGLTPGATYYFSATSVGANGAESGYSTEITYTVPLSTAPAPNGGVSLGWDASTAPSVAGYNVYYGVASGNYTNKTFAGSVTNVAVTGLVPGTTYYFAATSVGTNGTESGYSAEISYTVPNPAVLAMNTVRVGGTVTGIALTATGGIPAQWTIQSSTDLQNWTPMVSGTNSAVNVNLAVGSAPHQFFRLVNQ